MVKRIISIACVLAMVLTLLTACNSKGTTPTTQDPGTTTAPQPTSPATTGTEAVTSGDSWKKDTSPVTLTLFYDKTGGSVDFDKYWGKEPVSKKWIAETGVNVEFQFPPDDDHSKLNVIIASGTYPDMIYAEQSISQFKGMAANDLIWAIDELEKTAAPGFIERNIPDVALVDTRVNWDSMHLYAAPMGFYRDEYLSDPGLVKNSTGMAVVDYYYNAIGRPEFKTTDDLLAALRKIKQQFPDVIPAQSNRNASRDGDGNPRLIARTLPIFGLAARYYQDADGVYKKYWNHENFLTLLKFVNTLYNEELIDKTELTDKSEQTQAKLFSGRVFIDMNQEANNLLWFNGELHKTHPDWNYEMVSPPGMSADQTYANDSFGGGKPGSMAIAIPKGKNAERVLQFLDFLYQPQTMIETAYGLEGQGYTLVNGKPISTPEILAAPETDRKSVYGACAYWCFGAGDVTFIRDYDNATEETKNGYAKVAPFYKDYSFFSGAESYDANSEEIKIKAAVKEIYEVEIMNIIMCPAAEVESRYTAMMEKMKAVGLDKLDKSINDYFQAKASIEAKYSADLK